MADVVVSKDLEHMDRLDFDGWDKADWEGTFSNYHTDDVFVQWKGQPDTHGLDEHIKACKEAVAENDGKPFQITAHPIKFGQGEWTCVVGELDDGSRMVTVAKWREGQISEEYIWL